VRSHREGQFAEAEFARGKLIKERKGRTDEKDGTLVRFTPDEQIFGPVKFKDEHVRRRLRLYTYLNAELTFLYNGETFVSENGLLDLIEEETGGEAIYPPFHYRSKTLELAFTHSNRFNETHYSFVNGQYTSDGGTHLSAFREGILKAVNSLHQEDLRGRRRARGHDRRGGHPAEGPGVRVADQEQAGQHRTAHRAGEGSAARGGGSAAPRPQAGGAVVAKVRDTEKLRKELQQVKKLARERARATSIRIPQLKDCKHHLDRKRGGADSMVFITEGQSAAGSIVSCRDVHTQAIFTCSRASP
jgi:topoisomerase-4 subunit B